MPLLSIVVAAYNVDRYIARCLDSLVHQSCNDIEVVVVNDGSTDSTLSIIQQFAASDDRVHIINKHCNEGTHLARKSGVAATHGDYVMFVDGDDELELTSAEVLLQHAIKRDFDILRFGRSVIPESTVSQTEAWATEASFNAVYPQKEGIDIVTSIFSDVTPFRQTWCVIDCVFSGDFVRASFSCMTSGRLGRMQDAYEFFVLASRAHVMLGFPEFHGLRYHFGAGVSGTSMESIDRFQRGQEGMHFSTMAVMQYAGNSENQVLISCSQWFLLAVIGIVGREWCTRLNRDDQLAAVDMLRNTWGDIYTAGIILEPLLPRARYVNSSGRYPDVRDEYVCWSQALQQLDMSECSNSVICNWLEEYRSIAAQIEEREQARLAEQSRREQEQREARRLFKSGTWPRRMLDRYFPEGGWCRRTLRKVACLILRR